MLQLFVAAQSELEKTRKRQREIKYFNFPKRTPLQGTGRMTRCTIVINIQGARQSIILFWAKHSNSAKSQILVVQAQMGQLSCSI